MEIIANSPTKQALSLKLIPTKQCNFRCMTCYEHDSIGRMSKDRIQQVKNLIDIYAPNINYLSVEWFGGEPLIATHIIYDISDHILAEISKRNIRYISQRTTDGLQLGLNTFKKLLSKGVKSYRITLDGFTDKFNRAKHSINGSGSLGQVWFNLLSIKKINDDFDIMIKLPINSEKHASLRELCELIQQAFSNDQRFGVLFETIENPEMAA